MWQGIFFGFLLTVASILAIPNLFVSKKDELTTFFKKLILLQGWIGLLTCIVGAIVFVQCAMKIATMMAPILWLTEMLCNAALTVLGFLLSYGVIYTYFLSKGKKAEENLNKMRTSVMPLQGKIGIFGVLIGIWSIMAAVMFA
jgi:hypothetical protein